MSLLDQSTTADHLAAVKVLLVAALPASVPVWSWSEATRAPDNLPPQCVLVALERVHTERSRLAAYTTATAWRVALGFLGEDEDNANLLADLCNTALLDVALPIGGRYTTPVSRETSGAARFNDGRIYADATYTYRL